MRALARLHNLRCFANAQTTLPHVHKQLAYNEWFDAELFLSSLVDITIALNGKRLCPCKGRCE
jgi:hypothetical protein